MTYTYVILEISKPAYDEIAKKLKDAGYDQVFHEQGGEVVIDMHGIAVKSEPQE